MPTSFVNPSRLNLPFSNISKRFTGELAIGCILIASLLPSFIGPLLSILVTVYVLASTKIPFRRDWTPLWVALAVLGLFFSYLLAIPASGLWGAHRPAESILAFILMVPAVLIFWLAKQEGERQPLMAFCVFVGMSAFIAFLQGVSGHSRVWGLTQGPNVTAGVQLISAMYLYGQGHGLLGMPLLWSIPFTGSRWTSLVAVGLLGFLAIRKQTRMLALVGVMGIVLVSSVWASQVLESYRLRSVSEVKEIGQNIVQRLNTVDENVASVAKKEEEKRLRAPAFLLPWGDTGASIHNVFLKIWLEAGFPAAFIWLGLSGWALWARPRLNGTWWALLVMLSLSLMDYYVWQSALWGLWFALVAWRLRR